MRATSSEPASPLVCPPNAAAIQASGNVHADVLRSVAGGKLTFGDLFRVFPLGENSQDDSIGNPLVRAYIWTAELKGAMELSVSTGFVRKS